MKDLIAYIAQHLVDDTEAVRVNEYRQRRGTVYELLVAKDETGRVIGREGKIANAIRIVLDIAAEKQGERVALEIN
ncbi:MAG TPA: KH domain-containing protein [Thermoflexales bacterium]|nr:KH domain-containing protein [Thermoflexales bacterium]HQW34485.1 KH domain-containing protein [Thermoflexales bacterium]HQX75228.1 KH domain-containing protein [Thermoflexales bacterium]HQZ22831.1 KH domain-containing protein [Thermoflexales bacterium]HRA01371.1 KH domain-containing protein [Thermoflexales bacterium]